MSLNATCIPAAKGLAALPSRIVNQRWGAQSLARRLVGLWQDAVEKIFPCDTCILAAKGLAALPSGMIN